MGLLGQLGLGRLVRRWRAWDLVCYPASLLWSPGPRPSPVFRSVICDCLSLNVPIPKGGAAHSAPLSRNQA